jgi:hypothetical protein
MGQNELPSLGAEDLDPKLQCPTVPIYIADQVMPPQHRVSENETESPHHRGLSRHSVPVWTSPKIGLAQSSAIKTDSANVPGLALFSGKLTGEGRSLPYLTGPRYLSSQLSDSLIISVRGT